MQYLKILVGMWFAMVALMLMGTPVAADGVPQRLDVRDFGAKGDGVNDDTEAINRALRAAEARRGVVYMPEGMYRVSSTLEVPSGVTLIGAGERWENGNVKILILEPGFVGVRLNNTSGVRGLHFVYANNSDLVNPIPYPPAIELNGINPSVENIHFTSAWDGISVPAGGCNTGQCLIRNITGFVHNVGIRLNGAKDIVRIENVHWFVQGGSGDPERFYYRQNRIGFDLSNVDGIMASKLFMIGGKYFLKIGNGGLSYYFSQIWGEGILTPIYVDTDSPHDIYISQATLQTNNRAGGKVVVDLKRGRLHLSEIFLANNHGADVGIKVQGTAELTVMNSHLIGNPGIVLIELGGTGSVLIQGNKIVAGEVGVRVLKGSDNYIITSNVFQNHVNIIDDGGKNKIVTGNLLR